VLHLVTRTPALAGALAASGGDDDVVLMHQAVLAAVGALPRAIASGPRLHAMTADLLARGLAPASLPAGVAALDDAGLVALAVAHRQSLTWS